MRLTVTQMEKLLIQADQNVSDEKYEAALGECLAYEEARRQGNPEPLDRSYLSAKGDVMHIDICRRLGDRTSSLANDAFKIGARMREKLVQEKLDRIQRETNLKETT